MIDRSVLVAIVSMAIVQSSSAQENWTGKWVFLIKNDVPIVDRTPAGKQVVVGKLSEFMIKVLADEMNWLKASDARGHIGWFKKTDAVVEDKALEYFEDEVVNHPNTPNAYYHRAVVRHHQNDVAKALDDFAKSLEIDGEYVPTLLARGQLFKDLKKYDDALKDYNEAIHLHTLAKLETARIYLSRGHVWAMKKEYARAIQDLDEAFRQEPKWVNVHYDKACIYALWNKTDEAIASLEIAIANGFSDAAYIESDSDFDSIRQDRRYKMILAKLKKMPPK